MRAKTYSIDDKLTPARDRLKLIRRDWWILLVLSVSLISMGSIFVVQLNYWGFGCTIIALLAVWMLLDSHRVFQSHTDDEILELELNKAAKGASTA